MNSILQLTYPSVDSDAAVVIVDVCVQVEAMARFGLSVEVAKKLDGVQTLPVREVSIQNHPR